VFAPTDDAFDKLPDGLLEELLADVEQLTKVLTYHVYEGNVLAADAIALDGETIDMLNGLGVTIDVVDGNVVLNLGKDAEATVIITDIVASNGVIHVIDTVLNPADAPNIVERAQADEDLETLVTALVAADLVDTLSGDGPFTVFAPTDDAFDSLPDGLLEELLADVEQLTKVLTYHVYSGNVLAADAIALDGETIDMLNGLGVTIDVVEGSVVLNLGKDAEATVIITDIVASNGVIHVIDTVLNPADAPNIVERAQANEDLETLVTAVVAADLVDTLSGDGPFTVFAPTDEAFGNLPEGALEALLADTDALTDLLTYHVLSGEVLAADAIALDGQTVTMVNGDDMAIDVVDGNVVLNQGGNREATVIVTDVLASNGVIHIIDAVLDTADAD
jgi:transforming growth factor-beta-induced protein